MDDFNWNYVMELLGRMDQGDPLGLGWPCEFTSDEALPGMLNQAWSEAEEEAAQIQERIRRLRELAVGQERIFWMTALENYRLLYAVKSELEEAIRAAESRTAASWYRPRIVRARGWEQYPRY